MSQAIDDLKHDHKALLSAMMILDEIAADIGNGSAPDRADLRSFTGFLKEFADTCHHGKEERFLFPALVRAGVPERNGPIGAMLSEHAQGRDHLREMEQAMASGTDYVTYAYAARAYSSLLKSHIEKENGVLFPTAEKVLNGPQMDQLYKSFEEHEERVIGHGRHEELHQLLRTLQNKYLK
jgi:hemerythrin-like domain-containing protein